MAEPLSGQLPTTADGPPSPPTVDADPPTIPPPSAPTITVGGGEWPTVAGYEILDVLGRGGMGVVYKARDCRVNRVVALKMILAGGHASSQDVARFLAESEAVAQLQHPNIVQLYGAGQHDGLPYFTLEFVPGGSLADRLRESPLPPRDAARLVEQLAHGIQHAHERGIIHRDLKPGNILLASGGRKPPGSSDQADTSEPPGGLRPPLAGIQPKITDFGLARRVEVGSGLTATGAVLGTPSYMAPEQAEGKKTVVPPADIYALGAILYECVSGRPPFRAATPLDTILQVLSAEPVPLSEVQAQTPHDLATIYHKCLQKDPMKRYPTAAALADDLRRFLNGEPIQARPVGQGERLWRWCRRNPRVAMLTAAIAAVVLIGTTVSIIFAIAANREVYSLLRPAPVRSGHPSSERRAGRPD